jgi:hypothetical protein
MILGRRRIRILADAAIAPGTALKDIFTGGTPASWRGNDIQFEIAIGVSNAIITDISNIASLTVTILDGPTASANVLVAKTVLAADLNGALTSDQWAARTHQHALVYFTNAEMSPAVAPDTNKVFWVAISYVTNDSPGRDVTPGCTTLQIYEDGVGAVPTTMPQGQTIYTQQEADARYVQKHEDQAWARWHNGRWYHYIQSTDRWYPEIAEIRDGAAVLTLGPGEEL